MPYTLKIELDGWELGVLLRILTDEVFQCARIGLTGPVMQRYARLAHVFADEVGYGMDETMTLKVTLSLEEQALLESLLKKTAAQYRGDRDNRAKTVAAMHEQVRTYRESIEAVKEMRS